METPNTKIYESVETEPSIDFLDEHLKVTFSFEDEAVSNLPEVSDDDLKTGQEKYRILLGDIDQQDTGYVNVRIRGVLEADSKEKDLLYSEGVEKVSPKIGIIREYVKSIQKSVPEYKNFNFIGDIHTHPITNENDLDEDIEPCTLSDNDTEAIIREYERGNLSSDEPFIFGVAGRNNKQEKTSYAFYRLVKKDGEYVVEQIEKID